MIIRVQPKTSSRDHMDSHLGLPITMVDTMVGTTVAITTDTVVTDHTLPKMTSNMTTITPNREKEKTLLPHLQGKVEASAVGFVPDVCFVAAVIVSQTSSAAAVSDQ